MTKLINTKTLQTTLIAAILAVAMSGCSFAGTEANSSPAPKNSQTPAVMAQQSPDSSSGSQTQKWRPMTEPEKADALQYILNRPLGIAALNQLAIEGFISPQCPKTFYTDETGFQTLLRVKCPDARGVSIAVSYDEMRVIFNRFEDNIESFQVQRVSDENRDRVAPLPE